MQKVGSALRKKKDLPQSTDEAMSGMIQALADNWQLRLDQVTALVYAAEACEGQCLS